MGISALLVKTLSKSSTFSVFIFKLAFPKWLQVL